MEQGSGIVPFISYTGNAEEAVNFYVSLFPGSKIEAVEYFGKGERGVEGKVKNIGFTLMGRAFMAMDFMVSDTSDCPVPSWLLSLYVNCADEKMFDAAFNALAKEGRVLMGPEGYGDFQKVAWITDKFGVTWQMVCV